MKKISKILNYIVFFATTLAIAGVFYEGMALKWFDVVGILVIIMDASFVVSTMVNLVVHRKSKWLYINIFSAVMISIAVIMKMCGVSYSIWSLVFWYFYIWFIYGKQISTKNI